MIDIFLIISCKLIALFSRLLNLGHGSTWPGHIALSINSNFIKDILRKNYSSNEVRSSRSARTVSGLKIILIAGTNGKTTTGRLIQTILENSNYKVFQNQAGANLLNGIASSLILRSNIVGKLNYEFVIFEIDENTLPLVLKEFVPNYLVLLNLFRDQLDRYGEVNTIADKWKKALENLSKNTILILNADDPQIASLGLQRQRIKSLSLGSDRIEHRVLNRSYTSVFYFGLNDKKLAQTVHQHAVDSTYCPNCSSKLYYSTIYYSHLGNWKCKDCNYKRPKDIFSTPSSSKLTGIYNLYNILASTLVAKKIGVSDKIISNSLKAFTPAFGRQEILDVNGKKIQIFLSKNPTSFNESLRTITDLKAKDVLFVLNDRIPDGRDVSWIWDVDFEYYINKFNNITVSGDRTYDMALRIKYASKFSIFNFQFSMKNSNFKFQIEEDLKSAISLSLKHLPDSEALYILPTYSAMLEVRKILTGKKIL